jgi:ferredoxin
VLEIEHIPYKPSIIKRANVSCYSCCISCETPYCIKYLAEEIEPQSKQFSTFPVDFNDYVCPTSAILWEKDRLYPSINPELCINCGLCAARCPMGAIYLGKECAIVYTDMALVEEVHFSKEELAIHKYQVSLLIGAIHSGQMLKESDEQISVIYQKMADIKTDVQFPNIFTRNLFIETGNRCFIRRRGDVYLRIDAIMEMLNAAGIVEVEFNKDSLESPRAILDDIAVLISRYDIDVKMIIPFIVSLEFPNIRTEYWRVIKDIANVLKIKINSLSIGVLMMFIWNFCKIDFSNILFYADTDKPSIRREVQLAIGFEPNLSNELTGILEPKK